MQIRVYFLFHQVLLKILHMVEVDPNAKLEPTEVTIEEKRSKQGRMALMVGIGLILVIVLVLLFYVVRDIYYLL